MREKTQLAKSGITSGAEAPVFCLFFKECDFQDPLWVMASQFLRRNNVFQPLKIQDAPFVMHGFTAPFFWFLFHHADPKAI